ncbi:NAD(P)H-dependent glycerol-3-phosphate dehydrogenase [Porticoccaceae bacterium LTM1]|nr:NAD(P)H-dependent glycerol-3-phosphate dehydrogenase [Porticoccaceae bacterium LTM1]
MSDQKPSTTHKITVLGGGSFGTAIANMIAINGYPVTLWMRDEENAEHCRTAHENTPYLPGYKLTESLAITSDISEALRGSDIVFFSVPSKAFRTVAKEASKYIEPGTIAISTAKGIEPSSFKLMSQVLGEELTDARIGVISGPNLAKEIADHQITATVVASEDDKVCKIVQDLLGSQYFRVYANSDPFGVELAGALKNIYALGAGIAAALGVGQNTMSVLVTRSLAEMSRFAMRLGADPMTFLGLSGVGDLYVTCTSPLSRNYRVGYALGKGKTLEQATEEVGQVAEGVNTTRLVKQKADEMGIYMPLATALFETMFNNKSIRDLMRGMMLAEQAADVEFSAQ